MGPLGIIFNISTIYVLLVCQNYPVRSAIHVTFYGRDMHQNILL